ncbi:MAG: aminopeptidase [Candidatus Woesearchaeota archaeon]
MVDDRVARLADILVNHSIRVRKGDVIKINFGVEARELALEVYRLIVKKGALPRVEAIVPGFSYAFFKHASLVQLKSFPSITMYEARHVNGSISIGGNYNSREFSNIDPQRVVLRSMVVRKISNVILKTNNWVGCDYPAYSLAQDAEMSLVEFEDFLFTATNQDWQKESKKQDKIKAILDKGSFVRILGEETDVRFSIKGRTAIKADGHHNMPDGEVFIAPQEKTVEGSIYYSYPTIKDDVEVDGVRLSFKKGKVIRHSATKNLAYLSAMLAMDKGSSYVGEFGIGTNYLIPKFTKQILFDEKMGGTIHLALGMAYKEGGGRNESALHWDMVKDLRYGGEVWVDDFLLQKNGKFTIKL